MIALIDCSLIPPTVQRAFKLSWRKLLLIDTKQRNSQKLSLSKFSRYNMVEYLMLTIVCRYNVHFILTSELKAYFSCTAIHVYVCK